MVYDDENLDEKEDERAENLPQYEKFYNMVLFNLCAQKRGISYDSV